MKFDTSLRGKPFLLAPLPFVLIVIYGALFARWPNDSEKKLLSIFTDIVLFNTLHGYFTLAMIFCLPAAGVWLKERDAAGRRSFLLSSSLVALALFIFTLIFLKIIETPEAFRVGSLATFEFLLPLVALQHNLWQSMGISIALSHLERSTSDSIAYQKEQQRIGLRERRIFMFMLFAGYVPLILRWMGKYSADLLPTQWTIEEISLVSSLTMFCCVAAMIYNLSTAAKFSWHRGFYLLRLVSWALVPISPYGYYTSAAIHGIEYAFVLALMIGPGARAKIFWGLAGFLALGVALRVGTFAFYEYEFGQGPLWLGLIMAAGQTFATLHYHLDRELFTMRWSENRRFTGAPLLRSP
ncbi:MAG: hypothetical protein IPJ84_01710 [Bdellovibrionales bacterium]|nr:hypothetical protein [Bdellovibrionales bacterium]